MKFELNSKQIPKMGVGSVVVTNKDTYLVIYTNHRYMLISLEMYVGCGTASSLAGLTTMIEDAFDETILNILMSDEVTLRG